MKRPVPVRHWTISTVSDHDAYLVTYLMPDGSYLTLGTFNLSIAAVRRHPDKLLDDLVKVAFSCDVLLIQEAGAARRHVMAAAAKAKRRAYFGEPDHLGAASTPILANPRRLEELTFQGFPILGRRRLAPPAAGPSRSKPKYLNVARFTYSGLEVAVGNIHATPSTRFVLNATASLLMFARSSRRLARLDVDWRAGGGDLNQSPGTRFLAAWRGIGLRSSQRRLGPIGTHGKRPIDDIYGQVSRHV